MFLRKKLIAMLSVAAVVLSVFAVNASEKGKVVIKGSTTVLPITMKAIEAFKSVKPEIGISVEGSGSGNGIKALLDGTCDIANSSREMKPEEKEKGKSSKMKIREITIAYDMIVPIVHPSNKIKNLSKDQLKQIFDGTITNWKQVGGDDRSLPRKRRLPTRPSPPGRRSSWLQMHRWA